MNRDMFLALANNATLLLTLSIIYELQSLLPRRLKRSRDLMVGLLVGLAGIAIMSTPFVLRPGLVIDTRTILISITALIYGPLPTGVAVLILSFFRILTGGIGLAPGLATIVSSASIGLLWRRFAYRPDHRFRWLNVYVFSIIVHLTMLACMLLLPWPIAINTIRNIAGPVLLIYPVASVLYSLLLLRQQDKAEAVRRQIEAEQQYRSLFENNHAIMLLIDPDAGRVVDANPAAAAYYGWPVQQLKQMKVTEINTLPPEEIAYEMSKFLTRSQYQMLFRHRRADGSIRDVEVYSGPIINRGRELLYAIVHDVTERVQAEQSLKESEVRFRAVVENDPDSIIILSHGQIIYLNPATLKLFDANSQQDLLGQPILERVHPDHRLSIRDRLKNFKTSDSLMPTQEYKLLRMDQSPVTVEATSVPIFYNNEDCLLVFYRDISLRKQFEKERLEMEAKMRQQQKLEAIGTLASGVAHEINNPIMGIINYAQLILDEQPDVAIKTFAQEIMSEGSRVAEITNDLLFYSRQQKQSHSLAHLDDIVRKTMNLIGSVLRKDLIIMQIQIPDGLPPFKCRSQQIQQILMNLLTNARDALNEKYPKGDPDKVILVSAMIFEKTGRNWIRLTVEDHGRGIPPEIRDKLFDPFFTTKPRDVGTGLGLPISIGIARDHHGELTFETTEGQYTRFHLDLPVDNGWEMEEQHLAHLDH